MAKKTSAGKVAAEVGAGLAAAGAVAAAGYYFYGSKDAKKHRKVAAKWATGMQKEVLKQAKKLPKVDAKSVSATVDAVVATYQGARSVNRDDLMRAAKELKANWKAVRDEATRSGKRSVARGKKTVRKGAAKAKARPIKRVMKSAKERQ